MTAARLPELLVVLDEGVAAAADAPARFASALATGAGGVLVHPSPATDATLTALPRGTFLAATLPDMAQLPREIGERGAARVGLDRLRRAGVVGCARLAATVAKHVGALARQDFAGVVPVLVELELARLPRSADAVALSAPLTDLLLAARHRACLAHVVDFVRRRTGGAVGFETLNLGHLLPRLDAWGIAPDFAIGPLNAAGFRRQPSAAATLAAVAASRIPILASEPCAAGTIALAPGTAFARAHGAVGVVASLDDVAGRRDDAVEGAR
jgi:hypothetical protein